MQGSWTKQLQNCYQNLQRKPRNSTSGLTFTPPAKKQNTTGFNVHHGLDDMNSRDLLDDESNLKQLDQQLAEPIKNRAAIGSLMSETAPNRRKWIIEENPLSFEEVSTCKGF